VPLQRIRKRVVRREPAENLICRKRRLCRSKQWWKLDILGPWSIKCGRARRKRIIEGTEHSTSGLAAYVIKASRAHAKHGLPPVTLRHLVGHAEPGCYLPLA